MEWAAICAEEGHEYFVQMCQFGGNFRCNCASLGSISRCNLGCKCAANFGVQFAVHAYAVIGCPYKNRPASITTALT